MIKGLTHVAVQVTDLERSLRFYCEGLGLKEHFRLTDAEGRPALVYLQLAPGEFIELFPRATEPAERNARAGAVHLCIEVEDIHLAHAAFSERGVVPHSEPRLGADGAWQFWTSDPDGMRVEFQQLTPQSRQLGPPDEPRG